MGRKNKNGRSRPHVNKYINQKGRLLRKQRTARSEKTAQQKVLRRDTQQQENPQQVVQRFEIWFAELGDHYGSSVQSGSRPVLVISNDMANRNSPIITVIPMSSKLKKLDLPVHIPVTGRDCEMFRDEGLEESILLVEQNAKMALKIASRAYVLETGKIAMSGDAGELAKDPKVQEAYLGG